MSSKTGSQIAQFQLATGRNHGSELKRKITGPGTYVSYNHGPILGLSDDDISTRLTSVRGIGPWTVQMLLIFRLGRPDVMPSTDLGIRKGFGLVYGWEELPPPKFIMDHSELWIPYRSVASWYLWRSLELEGFTPGAI